MADASTIIREIEAAYHHYIDVFNREDVAGFVGCYTHPHTMLSGEQGLSTVNTEADHQHGYQQIMKTLHKQEWGRSGIDRMQIWPFSESLAQLVADVTRYKKDGSVLEKLRACYMLRRTEGGWKILAFGLVAPPFLDQAFPGQSRASFSKLITRSLLRSLIMSDAVTIIREVEDFYRAFIDGFNREDTDMYLRSFCYPNGMLSGEKGMIVNAKESDQQRFYQQVTSDIQSRGWDHTDVDTLQVFPLTDTTALLMADLRRRKKDNTVLESGRYCYTVRKEGGAWKILTLTAVKPPFTGVA